MEHAATVETLASTPDAVVAGHICLDVIPDLGAQGAELHSRMTPGSLLRIGPAVLSTGGAVSNTGLGLHRLGVPTRLMGKVGDDAFGRIIRDILSAVDPRLAKGMIVSGGEHTSYTLVISPPGVDRLFLHHSGTNDTFSAHDIDTGSLVGVRLFHFGYPPIMRRLYSDGGTELVEIFRRAKSEGLTTSLDMTQVDRTSDAARVDWRALLRRVLPYVDIFLPSLDEITFMVVREAAATGETLNLLSRILLDMGSSIIVLKLGDQGLYLRTAGDARQLAGIGRAAPTDPVNWTGRELLSSCFKVTVAGTTGAGDCTIAGFLAGLLNGMSAEDAITAAVGAGACCVERPDATSGVPSWNALQRRIAAGWQRQDNGLVMQGWRKGKTNGLHFSPLDAALGKSI